MHIKIVLSVLSLVTLFFSACSTSINVRALEPAQIDRASLTKKITVVSFKNDRVGLSGKIESNLANHRIDNKNYFTIVNRSDFDKVLREQKLQNSGLVKTSTAVEVGNLIGAQAIISGNVGRVSESSSYHYERRTKCMDKKCKEIKKYKVRCENRVIGLSAEIRMIDVSRGDIIYADTMRKTAKYSHCADDTRTIPSKEIAAQRLAASMADSFTYKLSPHYSSFKVDLLEDPDLDYNDKQEELLEVSLEYIEQGRLDKAEIFLIKLIDSTNQQSYVPFYNLGVLKEVKGNYEEAQIYYKRADDLVIKPVKEISKAYIRIQKILDHVRQTKIQLAR